MSKSSNIKENLNKIIQFLVPINSTFWLEPVFNSLSKGPVQGMLHIYDMYANCECDIEEPMSLYS